MNDTKVPAALQAYRELDNIVGAHTITGHDRAAKEALVKVIDQALAAQRQQIADDILAYKDECTGNTLGFYAGMTRAAGVVRHDLKAGA